MSKAKFLNIQPKPKVCSACRHVNPYRNTECALCKQPLRKPSKHKNKPCIVDGIKFDSKKEAARWQQLQMLERAGTISELERQVVFELAPSVQYAGKRATPTLRYVADFCYFENLHNCPGIRCASRYIVEDSKGMLTPVYKIKKHLMMTVHKIEILET